MIDKLFRPVDFAWLAAFRVFYGSALTISMLRFLAYGWIDKLFVQPTFFFKFWGFEWIEPLPGPYFYVLFWVLAFCAFSMAIGFAFRVTSVVFAAGITYIQLIDVSNYLNHYYLAALLAWLLALSPANRAYSVDAWIRQRFFGKEPKKTVAVAWHYLFRFQIGTVYTFAGIAKANTDWLLHGQPLRIWLGAKTDLPILGPLFTIDAVPLIMSWCGFLFDTTIVWWLLWRKSRPYAYAVVIFFHVMTRLLFPIGMFPVIMVLSALVFFSPSWPRTVKARLVSFWAKIRRHGEVATKPVEIPVEASLPATRPNLFYRAAAVVGVLYCAFQLLMPLRFLVYGGNVLWHEQGMRFAWRVMLRAKGGQTTYIVRNVNTGQEWHVSPREYLNGWQESEMSSQPDLILQLAHRIHRDFELRGLGPVEVRVDSRVSLNGRRAVPFIDPNVNLAEVRDGLGRATWVLPAPSEPPPHTRPVL